MKSSLKTDAHGVRFRATRGTSLDVDLALEHRRKGLIWYPTYRFELDGRHCIANETDKANIYRFAHRFPQQGSVFES